MADSLYRPYLQAGFGTPERQNRWTVAFRLILAIPHFVVLLVLGIVAEVVAIIGWFGALIMGRLPRWAASYLSGFILYATRVYAYFWLMLDKYPPFGWGGHNLEYPINLDVPYGRVRRLAVFFRIILVFPAQIVLTVTSAGFQILLVFIWLIVLVAGRMPVALFGAIAALLRFEARVYAYFLMLTGKYPGELFGDSPVAAVPPGLAPTYPVAPAPAGFGADAPGAAFPPPVPPYPGEASVAGAPPPAPSMPSPAPAPSMPAPVPPPTPFGSAPPPMPPGAYAMPPAVGPPRTARLVLGTGSKRLLVLFMVLGVIGYVVFFVLAATTSRANVTALNSLVDAHDTLSGFVASAQGQLESCGTTSLSCNEAYQRQVADAFQSFDDQLGTISFPSSVQGGVSTLKADTSRLVSLLRQLSTAPDVATYQSEFSQAQTLGNQFDTDYQNLGNALF